MTTASAVYVGSVRHRRHAPVPHAFSYRLFMLYLDLAELPSLFDGRWLWSARRPALAWFRRRDHLGPDDRPLDESVRDLVEARLGDRPRGPIRLLTHLRYFGYCLNPVSFYYCFDARGDRLEAIVADVTNTPWGERHQYVLRCGPARAHRFSFAKEFHVSPFLDMDYRYAWSFGEPGERLVVHMENHRDGARAFDATLRLRRRPIEGRTLARALARHPFMTGTVVLGIYWQALRLWLKRCPLHPHPRRRTAA